MKRFVLTIIISVISVVFYAQSWQTGTNKIYVWPDTTNVGVGRAFPYARLHVDKGALKIGNDTTAVMRSQNLLKFGDASFVQLGEWEADDMLSFKATKYNFTKGNVGIGVTKPQYKLDVNGKVYIRTYETLNSWAYSYLYWQHHSLVMGTKPGEYAHSSVDFRPGGCNEAPETLYSQIRMYSSNSTTNFTERIEIRSEGNCWFDIPGNFGIGTQYPQYKLDVRGTIHASEIIVNTAGADFVFEDDYKLRPLQEVKTFIEVNRHLPEIPSAQEMQEGGMSVNQIVVKLLQKVEELTLYNIELEERINKLENNKQNEKQ